jgi:hypothetical protein
MSIILFIIIIVAWKLGCESVSWSPNLILDRLLVTFAWTHCDSNESYLLFPM